MAITWGDVCEAYGTQLLLSTSRLGQESGIYVPLGQVTQTTSQAYPADFQKTPPASSIKPLLYHEGDPLPEPPATKWHYRFLDMAKEVSQWSKDPSTKVGCVLVKDREIIATGYNGFPRGTSDSGDLYADRSEKYKRIVHAEMNALLFAGRRAEGSTMYVSPAFGIPPICSDCAKHAVQAGISEIVGHMPEVSKELQERWADSLRLSMLLFMEAGIRITTLPPSHAKDL